MESGAKLVIEIFVMGDGKYLHFLLVQYYCLSGLKQTVNFLPCSLNILQAAI